MAVNGVNVRATPQALIRSPLARAMYTRMMDDHRHQSTEHDYWYTIELEKFNENLCPKYVQSSQDEETSEFLERCYQKADWLFTQMYHLFFKAVMQWFMTQTSMNGYLNRGSMFVFSHEQFKALMGISDRWKVPRLLDLGAGDGMVTEVMARHFDQVYTTEASTTMVWRLQEKGYHNLELDEWHSRGTKYDLITGLNLLDRCDKPVAILHNMKKSLVPKTGRIMIAVVLPFRPYVEYTKEHVPEQYLLIQGETFEEQVNSFVTDVFTPAGLEVESFSRLPYLCEGDMEHSFYYLDDAVFVLKPISKEL